MEREPGFIDAYRAALLAELVAAGVAAETARAAVQAAEAVIRAEWGGESHYIPTPDKSVRDRAILQALEQGEDPRQVARKHDVHPSTVRRVRQRRQGSGFGSDDWVL